MASVASTYDLDLMSEKLPRSPHDIVGGLVYFPRMLDKIRLHARGDLPEAYRNNLGREFDGHCLAFLHVKYADLRERVLAGESGRGDSRMVARRQNNPAPRRNIRLH